MQGLTNSLTPGRLGLQSKRGITVRLLSLFPKNLYDTKMSPGRTMYLNYTGSQPGNSLVWSGIGWSNYDKTKSINHNLVSLEAAGEFDAIVVYKGEGISGLRDCPRTKVLILNEANNDKLVEEELASSRAGIVVFHHHGDFANWKWNLSRRGIVPYNWCHGCPVTPEVAWGDRETSVILSGCTAKSVYPLRHNALLAIQEGRLDARLLEHPGYRVAGRERITSQYVEYLEILSRSKVSICCSSIYKYPLAKMFESAMAGCVVATDLPDCPLFEKYLWPHCIRLDSQWEPERIAGEISLYTDDELRERGSALREAAVKHFSYKNWSDCLTSAVMDNC